LYNVGAEQAFVKYIMPKASTTTIVFAGDIGRYARSDYFNLRGSNQLVFNKIG